mmetsp:Transcript_36501/g.87583  ORF Transcript_36501/g.87583 Transcript_36501/m.87583 type:complete len:326 (-) Transcript_36501:363-1340(-)
MGVPAAAQGPLGQERRGDRLGPGGHGGGGPAEQDGAPRHRIRAAGEGGRAAHLRHPEHEAEQGHGAAARRPYGGGRHHLPMQLGGGFRRGRAHRRLRRHSARDGLHRAQQPAHPRATARGRHLRHGLPHQEPAAALRRPPRARRQRAPRLQVRRPHHRRHGQARGRHRRRRHRHRLHRHLAPARLRLAGQLRAFPAAARGPCLGQPVAAVATHLAHRLRTRGGVAPLRRRPPRLLHPLEGVPRRLRRQAHGGAHRAGRRRPRRQLRGGGRFREGVAGGPRHPRDGFPPPRAHRARGAARRARRAQQLPGQHQELQDLRRGRLRRR